MYKSGLHCFGVILATILILQTGNPAPGAAQSAESTALESLIPMPVAVQSTGGTFSLSATSSVVIEPKTAETTAIADYLVSKLTASTGYKLPILESTGSPASGNIYLTTLNADPTLGDEGYNLAITSNLITLSAYKPAGLFRGIQTIRQLLPVNIEASDVQPGPWRIATGTIRDYPRFVWRGFMLDVARHFFGVDDVRTDS